MTKIDHTERQSSLLNTNDHPGASLGRKQIFASLCLFWLLILCGLGLPAAQAQTQSIPQWLHGNLNTNDGRFRLQWQLPADAEYVRIRESGPLGAHSWFAYRSSESFVKNQPGTYT